MKNVLRINHTDRLIIMDRTFAKYAADTRSEEYTHLQRVRADYPEYTVIQRQINRKSDKKTYNGLTYAYMENYIKTHGDEEMCKANLAEFEEMKLISQCHSKAYRYPVIKNWFLEKYPEIKNFGMPQQEASDSKQEASADQTTAEVINIAEAASEQGKQIQGAA